MIANPTSIANVLLIITAAEVIYNLLELKPKQIASVKNISLKKSLQPLHKKACFFVWPYL